MTTGLGFAPYRAKPNPVVTLKVIRPTYARKGLTIVIT